MSTELVGLRIRLLSRDSECFGRDLSVVMRREAANLPWASQRARTMAGNRPASEVALFV